MNTYLSILIPVYNAESYIKPCVESIIAQSFDDMEILLIDDGSSDGSAKICKEYAQENLRIKYFFHENQGVAYTRNRGIELAQGKYIMFVDSDDILPQGSISQFIAQAEQDDDFIMSGYARFHGDTIISESHCSNFRGEIGQFANKIDQFLSPPYLLGPCFKLFKKEILKQHEDVRFPVELSYGEDAIFVMHYLKYAKIVSCFDHIGYLYRQENSNSLSGRFRADKFEINMQIAHLLLELLDQNNCKNRESTYRSTCVRFFDSFTTELIYSPLSANEKKQLFFKNARNHNIFKHYDKMPTLTLNQKLRKTAIQVPFLYYLMTFLYKCKALCKR